MAFRVTAGIRDRDYLGTLGSPVLGPADSVVILASVDSLGTQDLVQPVDIQDSLDYLDTVDSAVCLDTRDTLDQG